MSKTTELIKKRIIGRIQMYLFLLKYRWLYVFGSVGLVIGLVISFIEPPASKCGLLLAIISMLLNIISFAVNRIKVKQDAADLYEVGVVDPSLLRELKKSDRYDNYEFENFLNWSGLYCRRINQLLKETNLKFEFKPEKFKLEPLAEQIAPFALQSALESRAALFNDAKVRMISDLTEDGDTVFLQKTDYYSSICTNEMTCKKIQSRKTKRVLFDGLSLMSNNNIILDLEESKCSNHIGISTLAFTSDGKLVYTIQSAESAQSANLLAPSGSGSADLKDLERRQTGSFRNFLIRVMERELLEECGLKNKGVKVKTHLIGFARLLHRGGKPEFFGVSFLDEAFKSLKITNKEAVYISDIMNCKVNRNEIEKFKDDLKGYQKVNHASFSFLLYLHILFMEDYLDLSPDAFFELIGGNDQ